MFGRRKIIETHCKLDTVRLFGITGKLGKLFSRRRVGSAAEEPRFNNVVKRRAGAPGGSEECKDKCE
jgi:hypothetical protein